MLHGRVRVAKLSWGLQGIVLLLLCAVADLEGSGGVLFLDHPVEHEIVFVSHAVEQVLEELAEVTNIGFLLELKAATVVHVDSKLLWVTLGQGLDGGRELLVADLFILFLLSLGGQTLPGEAATAEVHEHEAEGLKIVSPRLLYLNI